MSQLHCFQLRTTLNGKDFKFFLMGYAQGSRTSFFNTCMKKNSLFWPINVKISFNTKIKMMLQVMTLSLIFVLMLISIFIDQNPKCFSRMCWRRMFCFSLHSPWETNLKFFPFKMVLSWKQCNCDVIIERVYYLALLPVFPN
jgi:hypothetical protein